MLNYFPFNSNYFHIHNHSHEKHAGIAICQYVYGGLEQDLVEQTTAIARVVKILNEIFGIWNQS